MTSHSRTPFKHTLVDGLPSSFSQRLSYARAHGTWPNVRNPRHFTEWVFRYKTCWSHDTHPEFTTLSDKVRAKHHIDAVLGPGWTTPTLWSGTSLDDLPRDLPRPFMLKANNGSGSNIYVSKDADLDTVIAPARAWTDFRFRRSFGEDWYNWMEFRYLVEPFLGEEGKVPDDVKMFCFGGEVGIIQVFHDRQTRDIRLYYDTDWTKREVGHGHAVMDGHVPRPRALPEMLEAARKLSEPFEFARIDFYDLDDGPRVGEITFAPASARRMWVPESEGVRLGQLWREGRKRVAERGGRLVDP